MHEPEWWEGLLGCVLAVLIVALCFAVAIGLVELYHRLRYHESTRDVIRRKDGR